MVQEYIRHGKEYVKKHIRKLRKDGPGNGNLIDNGKENKAKKKKKVQEKKPKKKVQIIKEKLASKAGPAYFAFILLVVFGGAAIGHVKCPRGYRNA